VLAAIPLGARVERAGAQRITLPALFGIAVVAAFFSLRSMTETLALGGVLPPFPAPWLLLGGCTLLGVWSWIEMPA